MIMKFIYLISKWIKQSAQDGATLLRESIRRRNTILGTTTSGEEEGGLARAKRAQRGKAPLVSIYKKSLQINRNFKIKHGGSKK